MPTAWASATEGSARRATLAVRTVFSCVASRNRERTSRPRGAARHSKTGFDSDKRNARGYSWSSTFTGSDARYLGFNYGFLARQASKTPGGRGFQLRCLQEEGVKTVPKKNPAFKCRAARPRATATETTVRCMTSAAPGTSGRRRFRRGVAVPTTCTSATEGSARRTTLAVGTVFRCVASRNRERTSRPRTKPPSPPSGPNPLGENQSLSSPPLKPRGLLLSVMRQKVGKDRSQEGYAPLANPHRNCPNLAKPSCGPTPAGKATSADELRAPPGVAVARATRRVAVVQLADQL